MCDQCAMNTRNVVYTFVVSPNPPNLMAYRQGPGTRGWGVFSMVPLPADRHYKQWYRKRRTHPLENVKMNRMWPPRHPDPAIHSTSRREDGV